MAARDSQTQRLNKGETMEKDTNEKLRRNYAEQIVEKERAMDQLSKESASCKSKPFFGYTRV